MRRLIDSIRSPAYYSKGKSRLYSFHGVRKNAACYLAELGLNDSEIRAVFGITHETVRHSLSTPNPSRLLVAHQAKSPEGTS
jgi:hypothetical protein